HLNFNGELRTPILSQCKPYARSAEYKLELCLAHLPNRGDARWKLSDSGRPPRPEGRGFHAPGWLRCGPCGATPFPPRPERRGSSGVLDGVIKNLVQIGVK